MYYQLLSVYEVIELGMRSAKKKPLTKKERAEKRKKKKEKQAEKWIPLAGIHRINAKSLLSIGSNLDPMRAY